jgi:hypothetical protein
MFRIRTIRARHHGTIHIILLPGVIKEEELLLYLPVVEQEEAVTATEPTGSVVLGPTLDMGAL